MERLGIVIVAAGKGARMKSSVSKQYLLLKHKPVLVHTLEIFEQMDEVKELVVVTGASDLDLISQFRTEYNLTKITAVVPGGADRRESVYEGLKALSDHINWVMIHDGVRPFVSKDAIKRCLAGARKSGAAVLGVPVKDTVKQINTLGEIISTPDRECLRAVQTPQAFRRDLIMEAHRKADSEKWVVTDDAALAERMGHKVVVVDGDYRNIKITTPEDLDIARLFLESKEIE